MMLATLGVFVFAFLVFNAIHEASALEIVNRTEWGAKSAKSVEYINKPVPYVIIHHSYIPPVCFTQTSCSESMRSMQQFHQDGRGWNDIGYTFAVGGDGKVYEGRGFNTIGAHAPRFNDKSIGICLIGDWQEALPPQKMLNATQELIAYAIEQGHVTKDYKLLGHKQVRDTICPGPALYQEIQTWPNFDNDVQFNFNSIL